MRRAFTRQLGISPGDDRDRFRRGSAHGATQAMDLHACDLQGLRISPDAATAASPQPDLLHSPGGFAQEALTDDDKVPGWIRRQAEGAHSLFSVCTGALVCGAAGLLRGRRATTH